HRSVGTPDPLRATTVLHHRRHYFLPPRRPASQFDLSHAPRTPPLCVTIGVPNLPSPPPEPRLRSGLSRISASAASSSSSYFPSSTQLANSPPSIPRFLPSPVNWSLS